MGTYFLLSLDLVALFVLLAVLTFVLGDYTPGHNGRSACSSQEEIDTKYYANNFDPTKYWHCEAMNVPATDKQSATRAIYPDLTKLEQDLQSMRLLNVALVGFMIIKLLFTSFMMEL
uniref:Uncharacterized protein n=1 Tax=Megaselia scalaris TaxID=36166 RepID=T1GQB1_MEGSC